MSSFGGLPASSAPARASAQASTGGYCATANATFFGSRRFLGVYASLYDHSRADLWCTVGRIVATHLGYVRDELDWATVETSPRVYDFGRYDPIMAALALHRLVWLPVVMDAPSFDAQKAPSGAVHVPARLSWFAAFMHMLVKRYGPGGSFWSAHPSLPYLPVRAWQIWNEPSLPAYWPSGPNPRRYTELLQLSWRAIKAVDPHALVVAAGVPFYPGLDFYQQMYRNGARRYFDVATFNDYSGTIAQAFEYLKQLRTLMNRNRDGGKPIWVTEFGWASGGQASPFQAGTDAPRRVRTLLGLMVKNRRALRLAHVFYYDWRDSRFKPGNWWGEYMGLYRSNRTPRPVASVISAAAAQLNR